MKTRQRVLLLNPPGDKLYLRDYYCSKVSKANYIYPPVDLVMLSGILNERFEVKVLDAIVENFNSEKCLKLIKTMNVDAIFFLAGSVSKKNDFEFMHLIKENNRNTRLIGSGDIFMEDPVGFLNREEWLDAVLLDFTEKDIIKYIENESTCGESIKSIVYRGKNDIIAAIDDFREKEFEVPIPRHDLFLNRRYSYPFVRNIPFSTVLTDYGCPFKCKFCLSSTLSYKYRKPENVIEELRFLQRIGIKDIYFADQTFGANKARTAEFCKMMAGSGFRFGWVCFSRADITDEKFLQLMKQAGCHTIIYGVESGSSEILQKLGKGILKDQIKSAFDLCRRYGITTVGTFILGHPDEDESHIRDTITFAKEIQCDYVSFNILVPRMRTHLRKELIEYNLINSDLEEMDQSGTYAVMDTKYLSKEKVKDLIDQAIREYFFRPSYIFKRAIAIRSLWDAKRLFGAGISILKNTTKTVKKHEK